MIAMWAGRALAWVLLLLTLSAHAAGKAGSTYEWRGSISAPVAYPVEIYEGALIASDYRYPFSPIWGLLNPGWGNLGGTMSLGDGRHALPHTLAITWYSVKEARFYKGQWPLDAAAIEAVWRAGTVDARTGMPQPYHTLLVGLAPKGRVTLWASGNTAQVQLAQFQAAPFTLQPSQAREDFQFFFNPEYRQKVHADTQLYPPEELATLKARGWPHPDHYLQYATPYSWQFDAQTYQRQPAHRFFYQTFSGERGMVSGAASQRMSMPLPSHVYAIWHGADGKEYVADFEFDYQAIRGAFERLGGQHTAITLRFEFDARTARLYGLAGSKRIELPYTESTWTSD